MYDPQIGRWHTPDPLMEWHFNYNPYHYCFNNPVNLIDPFGLDTTLVGPPIKDVIIYGKKQSWLEKTWNKFVTWLNTPGEGGYQPAGSVFTKEGGGASPTKQKATERTYGESNIEDVLSVKPNAGPKTFRKFKSPARMREEVGGLNSTRKLINNVTPDKKIVELSTGTGGKPPLVPKVPEATLVRNSGMDSAGVRVYKDSLSDGKVTYRRVEQDNSEHSSSKEEFERAWNNW